MNQIQQRSGNYSETMNDHFNDVKKCINQIQLSVNNLQEKSEAGKERKDDILLELEKTVIQLQENVQSSSANTTAAVEKMQSEFIAVTSSLSVDDIVQYELMKYIAKKIGEMPRKSDIPFWQIVTDKLLEAESFPKKFKEEMTQRIRQDNHSDADCALQFLIIYKSVVCKGKMNLKSLQDVLKKLGVVMTDLDDLFQSLDGYWKEGNSGKPINNFYEEAFENKKCMYEYLCTYNNRLSYLSYI